MTPWALARLVEAGLSALDLESLVFEALARRPRGPVAVVAIGKAAPAMARGALRRCAGAVASLIVVAPDGVDARGLPVLRAGHPIPDRRSVRAAERCLGVAREHEGPVVVLVSGGASALVCAPAPGVTLGDKRAVTRALLRSGATIQEINVVRKHLSRIKGGGLARAASPSPVVTLVASDVLGGAATDVGSGPSVSDRSTLTEARALLRRICPAHALLPLVRTMGRAPRGVAPAKILASPGELARVVARLLGARQIRARVLPPSEARIEALARQYAAVSRRLAPGAAMVRAAEPSLRVPARAGRGGRSTHLAALVGRDLPAGALFLALATDGVDGSSGTAGAIVDGSFARQAGDRLADAIARFDTGPLHVALGTAIAAGPSGHNLADLHVLVRR